MISWRGPRLGATRRDIKGEGIDIILQAETILCCHFQSILALIPPSPFFELAIFLHRVVKTARRTSSFDRDASIGGLELVVQARQHLLRRLPDRLSSARFRHPEVKELRSSDAEHQPSLR